MIPILETDNTYSVILRYLSTEGQKIVFKLFPLPNHQNTTDLKLAFPQGPRVLMHLILGFVFSSVPQKSLIAFLLKTKTHPTAV